MPKLQSLEKLDNLFNVTEVIITDISGVSRLVSDYKNNTVAIKNLSSSESLNKDKIDAVANDNIVVYKTMVNSITSLMCDFDCYVAKASMIINECSEECNELAKKSTITNFVDVYPDFEVGDEITFVRSRGVKNVKKSIKELDDIRNTVIAKLEATQCRLVEADSNIDFSDGLVDSLSSFAEEAGYACQSVNALLQGYTLFSEQIK